MKELNKAIPIGILGGLILVAVLFAVSEIIYNWINVQWVADCLFFLLFAASLAVPIIILLIKNNSLKTSLYRLVAMIVSIPLFSILGIINIGFLHRLLHISESEASGNTSGLLFVLFMIVTLCSSILAIVIQVIRYIIQKTGGQKTGGKDVS